MSQTKDIPRKEIFGHPVGLYVLFFTEMWERFSYYGMRAILVLYMISSATGENPGLGWSNENALALYGWYTMLVYLMSIPGGIIADKFIGQKKAVLIGGLILVIGHSVLAITYSWAFFLGLALIVIGVGGLKPNISTMVGGLYAEGDERRDGGFTIFYIGINLGAFLAAIIVGFVSEIKGWHYGFGLAGIGMFIGQLVFMLGQKYLLGVGDAPRITQSKDENTGFGQLLKNLFESPIHLIIVIVAILGLTIFSFLEWEGIDRYLYSGLFTFLAVVGGVLAMIYKDIQGIERDRFIVLLISFLIIIVFWGAFEQAGGLLNIYTDIKIDRIVSLNTIDILFYGGGIGLLILGVVKLIKKQDTSYIFIPIGIIICVSYMYNRGYFTDPYEVPTSVFQSVNALFIIIFGTIVSGFWYWWHRKGYENSSLLKMAIGTIIMGAGFLFMAKASNNIVEYGDKAALYLLILAYLFCTIGELCASPVALSFITKVAPVKYVSIMMGVYFAATGLGNKVAGSIGESSQAKQVMTSLIAPPIEEGFIGLKDFEEAGDFEIKGKVYLQDNKVVFSQENDLKKYIHLDQENTAIMINYLNEEESTKESPQTVIVRFSYDKNFISKIKSGESTTKIQHYTGKLELFEFQNNLEFKTYIYIFIFTSIFGILLLVFLRKLKKLAHNAED